MYSSLKSSCPKQRNRCGRQAVLGHWRRARVPSNEARLAARLRRFVSCGSGISALASLQREIVHCEQCRRLVEYRASVAETKRRAYRNWKYWGRPVPSFGDPEARLLLVGLAPGAHGANRTGRVFTGDASGDFLFDALHETGFASQPRAVSRDDGLKLTDCYIASAVRCVPPANRPTPAEFSNCRHYLEREIALLPRLRVVIALGQLALNSYLAVLAARGIRIRKKEWPFAHGASYELPEERQTLLCSYHPSRQNTQTGRLTKPMMVGVLHLAREVIARR